jgi:hypothetical protein
MKSNILDKRYIGLKILRCRARRAYRYEPRPYFEGWTLGWRGIEDSEHYILNIRPSFLNTEQSLMKFIVKYYNFGFIDHAHKYWKPEDIEYKLIIRDKECLVFEIGHPEEFSQGSDTSFWPGLVEIRYEMIL